MKKSNSELHDWLRPEYKRSDFGEFVAGKYADRVRTSTNVVVLDPASGKSSSQPRSCQCCPARLMSCAILGPPNIVSNPGARQSGRAA